MQCSPRIFFHLQFWIICQTTDFQDWKDWQTALLAAWSSSMLPIKAECSQIHTDVFSYQQCTWAGDSQAVHTGDKLTILILFIFSVKKLYDVWNEIMYDMKWYDVWKWNGMKYMVWYDVCIWKCMIWWLKD